MMPQQDYTNLSIDAANQQHQFNAPVDGGSTEGRGMKAAPYGKGHEDKDTFDHFDAEQGSLNFVPVADSGMTTITTGKYGSGFENEDTRSSFVVIDGMLTTEEGVTNDANQEYGQHYGGGTVHASRKVPAIEAASVLCFVTPRLLF
jgi:hypothetical protein